MRNTIQELPDRLPMQGLVSIPHGHDRQEQWPLLVFLHDRDDAGPAPMHAALTQRGPLRAGNNPLATSEFVVLAPQLASSTDTWQYRAMDIALVLDDIEPDYRIDPDRIYLTGLGTGADGVLDLALSRTYPWTALWAVDPTRPQAKDSGLPLWLSAGPLARLHVWQLINRLHLEAPGPTPSDRVFVDEGVDHVSTGTLAYADMRVYRWLLRQRRREVAVPAEQAAVLRG